MKKAFIPLLTRTAGGVAPNYLTTSSKIWTSHSHIGTSGFRNLSNSSSSVITRSNSNRLIPMVIGTATCIAATFLMMYKGAKPHPQGLFPPSDLVNANTETARIQERLQKHNLKESFITPDGNCQFRALADQIMEDQNRHVEVRKKITEWLKSNERYAVDDNNSACLGDFLDRDQYPSWENYCKYMSGNRVWGDHLTLVAATEAFGVELWILSSIDVGDSPTVNNVDPYITTLSPRIATPKKRARLAHYHELHYTSLHPDPTVSTETKTSAEPA